MDVRLPVSGHPILLFVGGSAAAARRLAQDRCLGFLECEAPHMSWATLLVHLSQMRVLVACKERASLLVLRLWMDGHGLCV